MEGTDNQRMAQPLSARAGAGDVERPFWCFISYRHADNSEKGREWASWLHRELETFEVPEDLVGTVNDLGQVIPERIYPVFRDEEELPAYADLSSAIIHALRRSLSLVVICSPASRQSKFVNEEVRLFKAMGRAERSCGMVIRGNLDPADRDSCLPLPLVRKVGPKGDIEAGYDDPLLVDMRDETGAEEWIGPAARRSALTNSGCDPDELEERLGARESRQREASLQLIAWVLGVGEDRLRRAQAKSRRRESVQRYLVWVFWLAVGLAALAAAVFGLRWAQQMTHSIDESASAVQTARRQAEQTETEARRKDEEAQRLRDESRYKEGLSLIHAHRLHEAGEALREASEHGHVAAAFEYARLLLAGAATEDVADAMRWLELAAAKGHPGALVLLGRTLTEGNRGLADVTRGITMLREGIRLGDESGVLSLAKALQKRSSAEARQWFRKAAEAGDAEACWLLGVALRGEKPASVAAGELPEWAVWLRKASDKGRPEAKREVGIAWWDGTLGPSPARMGFEERSALRGLLEVGMHGDSTALAFLRKLYADRRNYPQEAEAARAFAMEGAQAGVPEAMLSLAEYLSAKALAYNDAAFQEAWLWFNRASQAGLMPESTLRQGDSALRLAAKVLEPESGKFKQAALNAYEAAARNASVAGMLKAGRLAWEAGREDVATKWLTLAEQAGNSEARRLLASMLIRKGKDNQEALALLRKGVDLGDGESALTLGDWMASGARTPAQLALTLEVYLKGAEVGNGRSGLKAAAMIRLGKGGAASVVRAAQLERRAAETGDPVCMLERARRLIDGGFKQGSVAEAHAWLSMAAEAGLAKECAPLLARLVGSLDEPAMAESARLRTEFGRRLQRPSPESPAPR